jgi:spore coat polysaccharide biosynthesis protein SpsF
MKVIIIVQARMTSTRLPGKVLLKIAGKSLLEYQIERLLRVSLADSVVVATTLNNTDQPIVNLCNQLGVAIYRGDENDVLARYFEAAITYDADVIVRVTSDCPLIDPQIVDEVIQSYLDLQPQVRYVSNTLQRTLPRGMDTEVFAIEALKEAFQGATTTPDREHVTPFIYRQPKRYGISQVIYNKDESHHRWTVDTPEDFELIQRILEYLYPKRPEFNLNDCIELIAQRPEWSSLNDHVEQKKYGE